MRKFPQVCTRSEIKRIVSQCARNHPELRVGQAVMNHYNAIPDVWENNEYNDVVQQIYNHVFRAEYQNIPE